jgi:(R,R)-butanediol dehydrogenase/meso-butanediol dehydrogenase/diacetyl reductase
VKAVGELTGGAGADAVVECAGVPATGLMAGRIARRQGRVIILGVFEQPAPLDYTDLMFGEKTVMGSMGGYGMFDEAIRMMASGGFNGDSLITGRISLDDIVTGGFETLIKHKEEHCKILVSPD